MLATITPIALFSKKMQKINFSAFRTLLHGLKANVNIFCRVGQRAG